MGIARGPRGARGGAKGAKLKRKGAMAPLAPPLATGLPTASFWS